jgi:hypothetical protein
MTNSIGTFTFLKLDGNPEPLKEECIVLSRPGVEGVAVWKTGRRGVKLTLRSSVDAADLDAARALVPAYQALIGADAVELVWCDIELADVESFQVIVLDVRPVEVKAIIGGVGGLNSPSGGWCVCDWDVVAVPIVEESGSESESVP